MAQTQVIDCGGVLDITVVAQWCKQGMQALESGAAICLKADSLQRIDAAGLSAILSLFLAAKQRSIPMSWDNPSSALQESARLIGMSEYIELA